MSRKVLISYATKLGSTVDVAQVIGDTIAQKGIDVVVKPIKDGVDLREYDAVILGSAIRMGHWLPEAVDFVKEQQDVLSQIATAIFSVHILNQGEDPKNQNERLAYTQAVKNLISPKAEAFFAGKIEPSQLNFFESLLFKVVKSPSGDFRDWEAVRRWADEVSVIIQ